MCFDEAVAHFKARMTALRVIPAEPVESCSQIKAEQWHLNNEAGPLARVGIDDGVVS